MADPRRVRRRGSAMMRARAGRALRSRGWPRSPPSRGES
jgi:hypothetical protein